MIRQQYDFYYRQARLRIKAAMQDSVLVYAQAARKWDLLRTVNPTVADAADRSRIDYNVAQMDEESARYRAAMRAGKI